MTACPSEVAGIYSIAEFYGGVVGSCEEHASRKQQHLCLQDQGNA